MSELESEEEFKETSLSRKGPVFWKELLAGTSNVSWANYLVAPVRIVLLVPIWLLIVLGMLLVGSLVSFGQTADVPENWHVGRVISRWIDHGVDWMVVKWDPFFRAINIGLLR